MKTIYAIEHRVQAGPDAGMTHLAARGCRLIRLRPFAGDELPDPAAADGVLLMGGPQMITEMDKAPYLADEMDFAMQVMARGTPLLAICLGAQMIAHRLGASVDWHPDSKVAFGFHRISARPDANGLFPDDFRVLSGNAQGFELPPGAEWLASSETWPHQAYRIGERMLGFQFHPEVTRTILDDWQVTLAKYEGRSGADDPATQNADFNRYDEALKAWYHGLLDRFFELDLN